MKWETKEQARKRKEKYFAEQRKFLQNKAINHSIERAKERYDLEITAEDVKKIGAMIVNNKFTEMKYGSDHTTLFVKLIYNEMPIRVIYDVKINTVSTFLPF